MRAAIGSSEDVARFFHSVLQAATVPVEEVRIANGESRMAGRDRRSTVRVNISLETPRALRQAIGRDEPFSGRFDLPLQEGDVYLGRTSPIVEGLAGWTLDQALDPTARDTRSVASRCGVIFTSAVAARTTLLLARFRYHLQVSGGDAETLLCEEIVPLACTGPADRPQWLTPEEGERLLAARPERNLIPTALAQQLGLLLPALPKFQQVLTVTAAQRATDQLAAHERVREASRTRGRVTVQPVLPVDVLGAYVLLPNPAP